MNLNVFLSIVLLVVSVVLLRGKGSFLIAGYNTMKASEKRKYDEVALCKLMGFYVLTIGALLLIIGITSEMASELVTRGLHIGVLVVAVVAVIHGNFSKKVRL